MSTVERAKPAASLDASEPLPSDLSILAVIYPVILMLCGGIVLGYMFLLGL